MRSPKLASTPPAPAAAVAAAVGVTGRRKGTASRKWLVVSASGCSSLEEVGKQTIMRRTGLPARDLRVLDPLLSYPSTILGRERAIVINLEHIRAIITATEVFIPNSKDPLVVPFVQELQARVSGSNTGTQQQAMELSDIDGEVTPKNSSNSLSFTGHNEIKDGARVSQQDRILAQLPGSGTPEGSPNLAIDARRDVGAKSLPFEFRVLEVCLESACRCLEAETLTLEQEAYPALDELTSKISTLNLERVRQIKSRLVAISGRVQKVRDELEHLLDDDMDMAEMYLTEKLLHQPIGETSSRVDLDNDNLDVEEDEDEEVKSKSDSSHGSMGYFKPNIEELEMLLEAYFVQIDGTLNKLSTLREYVDDTEDYINIMLDEKQNQLLQMGVMLSTATLVITAGVVVVGIFGMNITIGIFNENTPYSKFWETTCGTVGGCIVLYILAIGWGKKSGLLQ